MSLQNDSREHPDEQKVRYGVVGAGWISQEDFMPGVEHTGNSVMTALVTSDRTKAKALAKRYAELRTNSSLRAEKAKTSSGSA